MLQKIKNSLKKTKTKVALLLILTLLIGIGVYLLVNEKDSKADYPYSMEKELYGYNRFVDADPDYTVKVTVYPHPDRLQNESFVEYYLNGTLVKKEKFR